MRIGNQGNCIGSTLTWLIPNVVVMVLALGMPANFFTLAGAKNNDSAHLAELCRVGIFAVGAHKVDERREHIELDVVKVVQDRVALDNAPLEHLLTAHVVAAGARELPHRAAQHGAAA